MSGLKVELKKSDHVSIVVESIKESSKFYSDLFGFKEEGTVKSEDTGDKYCALTKEGISTFLELVEVSDKSPLKKAGIAELGMNHWAFQVDDVESSLRELEKAGGELVTKEPIVLGDVKFGYAKMKNDFVVEVMEIPVDCDYSYQA